MEVAKRTEIKPDREIYLGERLKPRQIGRASHRTLMRKPWCCAKVHSEKARSWTCRLTRWMSIRSRKEGCSKIKRILRYDESRRQEALVEVIGKAISTVTAKAARAFFKHCDYGMLV